ncbi:MAG: transcriptional repressor [Alphaproteobacteria bacterium]|nr:transcriptional repressor [Alphaproteobacteria bacterium]
MKRAATRGTRKGSFDRPQHDHARCIADALQSASMVCAAQGVRLTEQRRRVLELVWQSHRPIGAYEILDQLTDGSGRRAAPPTVYRALDFLLAHGLIHRVESRNAFIGCSHPGTEHVVEIMLCTDCGRAAEIDDQRIDRAVRAAAAEIGFRIERQTIEIDGRCGHCQARPAHA